jgi:hypothetical protein
MGFGAYLQRKLTVTLTMINRSPISNLGLRVADVMYINALWKQTFATALAPAGKSRSATLGSHTGAETVLAFAGPFRWLVSAFHNRGVVRLRSESVYTRDSASNVNHTGSQQIMRRVYPLLRRLQLPKGSSRV